MKIFILVVSIMLLSGCASYFSARPPVIEDKVGLSGKETVGTLATAADYRVVYVRLDAEAKLCAEASADAGSQFGQTFATALSAAKGDAKPISASAQLSLAVAMKQLFKRSQGIQLFRDGSFALCNLYLNGGVGNGQYLEELKQLRITAAALIEKEIPFLEKIKIDPVAVPQPAKTPASGDDKKNPG